MASAQGSKHLIPALATAFAGSVAIVTLFASSSTPSANHLLVRAQSEKQNLDEMKPRLTKHPSGAFVPRAVVPSGGK